MELAKMMENVLIGSAISIIDTVIGTSNTHDADDPKFRHL